MKWISVARAWLVQNTPCTKLTAIQGIASIMPLGIRRDNKVAGRTELACEAIYRIYDKRLTDLPEILEKPACKHRLYTGVTARIVELASNPSGVSYSEIKSLKNGPKLVRDLVLSGRLRRDGDRFYKSDSTENFTYRTSRDKI